MIKHVKNSFVAWMLRTKYIPRWSLLFTLKPENVATHSLEVAVIAHYIAVIAKTKFNKNINPERICTLGVLHESSESGGVSDLPSGLKYHNPEITNAIKKIEHEVESSLVESIPDFMRDYMESFIIQSKTDDYEKSIVKAADHISMLIKTTEEMELNNLDHQKAHTKLTRQVEEHKAKFPEVKYFCETTLPLCIGPLIGLSEQ